MSNLADAKESIKRRVTRAVESATEYEERNPVGVIRRRFEAIRSARQPFIDEAKEMAELVVPGMYEGDALSPYNDSGKLFGLERFESANQSLIAQGTLLLSWTMANVILPASGDYCSRNIEQSVAIQLQALEDYRRQMSAAMGQLGDPPDFVPIGVQVNNELLTDDLIVRKHTQASNHQETLARCLFHSLISGISVFGHLTLTEAKAYTIQNSAVVFDSAHEPVEVIVVDRMPLVSLDEAVRRRLVGSVSNDALTSIDPNEQFVTIYTQQIRIDASTLGIRTEIEGIPIPELSFEVPTYAPVLIPLPFMFVNEADPYPIGWLTFNRGDCNEYENISLSIASMVEAAASCILGLPPGARITSEELRERPGLSVIPVGSDKAQIQAVVLGIAQNLQQVLGWHDKKERRMMMIFGMDFAVQRAGERVTAEEIQVMSAGLQKLFGATYKQTERTFQFKHAGRQYALAEEAKLIRPVDRKLYTLSLTAGLQQMEASNEIAKFDQIATRVGQVFGPQALQQFRIDAVVNWLAQKLKLDISDKWQTPQDAADQMGIGQLLGMVRSIPNGPQMLAQMMEQLVNSGGNSLESSNTQQVGEANPGRGSA